MTKIDERHFALVKRLREVLDSEPGFLDQQIAIELLTASHAMRFANEARFVADSMNKHVKQMMDTVK